MDPATYSNWHSGFYEHILLAKNQKPTSPERKRGNMREKRPIKVYIRVRPFNDEEKERDEASALEIYREDSRIKVLDERHSLETSYFFDGVFGEEDNNEKVYNVTAKPLIGKLLNGINCALLTYGQTGTGKTHTVLAEGSVTNYTIDYLFDRISSDVAHRYKISCSFVQVYQDKVYDLLNPESKDELSVREHPKKGIYVANLSHHSVDSAEKALELLSLGRKELIIAETRMVRQSSRSHAIFQLSIERRLDPNRARSASPIKENESLQSSQSDVNGSCDYEDGDMYTMTLEEDIILRGKIDICDLAGSERLGKTMAEGVRLSEAKHINSSLLELGNVIYALSEGTRRHIPFRNSTLTRLLQQCLGPQCRTSFIVCVAPTASEAYETRCSLNFGTRARKITNKERLILNVEVDYKILAKRLARRIECLEQELDKAGISQTVSFSKVETEAPISVQTQTELALRELEGTKHTDKQDQAQLNNPSRFPQLELLVISEIMTTFRNSSNGGTLLDKREFLCERLSCLLHELMDIVSRQHMNCSLTEDHWAEADLKQILKDSMDDLDLLRESIDDDDETSFQINDITKYTEYICKQFDERCQAMEEDMNYCLQKFQGLLEFTEDMKLHTKMKKMLEFLDNNRNGEIVELVNHDAVGFDIDFLSWLISVHMALRLALVLLSISNSIKVPEAEPSGLIEKTEDNAFMNETFESITSLNEDSTLEDIDKSYINFNSYDDTDGYAKASTPKRGHFIPLSIQNQLYNTSKDSSLKSKEALFHHISSYGIGGRSSGLMEANLWTNRRCLNTSLASDISDLDSIDGTLGEMDLTHEQRMKHRRLFDNNVMRLEEKCDLLEDKNSKLMRTLNVIMRENKDVNEKLRIMHVEKSKVSREIEDLEHQLCKITSERRTLESNVTELNNENRKMEKEEKKLNSENKQMRIQNHGLQRQISMKDSENESLRQQIAELKTEMAVSKADSEILTKKLESQEEKSKIDNSKVDELTKERNMQLKQLKELCAVIEKSLSEGDKEDSGKMRSCEVTENEGTFETELFVAIENNIRVEGVINDVRSRLAEIVGSEKEEKSKGKEGLQKSGVVIVEPKNAGKPIKRKLPQMNRSGDTKASALRRAKSLRSDNGRKHVAGNKDCDNVVPRGSKIKELMNEKMKIEKNYKELLFKNEKTEEELKTAKSQIEMLVSECGILDHELAKIKGCGSSQEEDGSSNCIKNINGNTTGSCEDSLFLRTKDIDKLSEKQDELHKCLEISQNKVQELERELSASKDENLVVKRHARDFERKYDEAKTELQHYQGQNYSQKIENSRLRDHVVQLSQELNREQQRIEQLTSKLASMKERNASQVRRLEGDMLKCVKKLDRYRDRERARRQEMKHLETSGKDSSEADSGLVPDHSIENLDLT